jgi:ATP synthase protein I
MPEYRLMFHRIGKYIFYLLALYVLGWGFTSYQSVFLGLIFGTSLSLINMWILVKKMDKFSKAIDSGGKVYSLGFFTRVAVAIFGVMIAMKYPQYFHFISVIIGLVTSYIVIMIDSFLQLKQLHKQ